jgi:hypothetical protein
MLFGEDIFAFCSTGLQSEAAIIVREPGTTAHNIYK